MNFSEAALDLDLLRWQQHLILKDNDSKKYIFDPIRKKYVILQPEEWIRQLVVLYLIYDRNYSKNMIQVEKSISLNGLTKRFDIVVYDRQIQPYLLVECKSADTVLDQKVFDQIVAYNMAMHAPYLMVTNGPKSYCVKLDHQNKAYTFFSTVPALTDIK